MPGENARLPYKIASDFIRKTAKRKIENFSFPRKKRGTPIGNRGPGAFFDVIRSFFVFTRLTAIPGQRENIYDENMHIGGRDQRSRPPEEINNNSYAWQIPVIDSENVLNSFFKKKDFQSFFRGPAETVRFPRDRGNIFQRVIRNPSSHSLENISRAKASPIRPPQSLSFFAESLLENNMIMLMKSQFIFSQYFISNFNSISSQLYIRRLRILNLKIGIKKISNINPTSSDLRSGPLLEIHKEDSILRVTPPHISSLEQNTVSKKRDIHKIPQDTRSPMGPPSVFMNEQNSLLLVNESSNKYIITGAPIFDRGSQDFIGMLSGPPKNINSLYSIFYTPFLQQALDLQSGAPDFSSQLTSSSSLSKKRTESERQTLSEKSMPPLSLESYKWQNENQVAPISEKNVRGFRGKIDNHNSLIKQEEKSKTTPMHSFSNRSERLENFANSHAQISQINFTLTLESTFKKKKILIEIKKKPNFLIQHKKNSFIFTIPLSYKKGIVNKEIPIIIPPANSICNFAFPFLADPPKIKNSSRPGETISFPGTQLFFEAPI